MRCGTRDGRTLARRRRLDPRLLVVRSRRATTEPWAARMGRKQRVAPCFPREAGRLRGVR